jgi:hypothetical protein
MFLPMETTRNIDTKFHTKAVIGTRTTEDGQTIDLVKATPRAGFPRARVFFEERCDSKRIAVDGGGIILKDWEAKGWI